MKKQLVLSFIFGTSIGSLITISCLEKYYEHISDVEIEKAREYYKEREKAMDDFIDHEAEEVKNTVYKMLNKKGEDSCLKATRAVERS